MVGPLLVASEQTGGSVGSASVDDQSDDPVWPNVVAPDAWFEVHSAVVSMGPSVATDEPVDCADQSGPVDQDASLFASAGWVGSGVPVVEVDHEFDACDASWLHSEVATGSDGSACHSPVVPWSGCVGEAASCCRQRDITTGPPSLHSMLTCRLCLARGEWL